MRFSLLSIIPLALGLALNVAPTAVAKADTLVILEVKATKGIPPWVYDGVVAAELRQKTIPKYISAVEALGLLEISVGGIYA